jgi:hypothetical protein
VVSQLQHPNILRVLDSGVTTLADGVDDLWCTMPYGRSSRSLRRFDRFFYPFETGRRNTPCGGIARGEGLFPDFVNQHLDLPPRRLLGFALAALVS